MTRDDAGQDRDLGIPEASPRRSGPPRRHPAPAPAAFSSQPTCSAVLLDRDGVINDNAHPVNAPDDMHLIPGAAAAIRSLNEAGLRVAVVTNQGGIASGFMTEDDLDAVHRRMVDLLAAEGAHVDGIYYCPHHPEGTVAKYATECPDRKPETGMLRRAREELGIDLATSVLVGDAWTDIVAGNAAGCLTILVDGAPAAQRPDSAAPEQPVQWSPLRARGRHLGEPLRLGPSSPVAQPTLKCRDLAEAVEKLLSVLDTPTPSAKWRDILRCLGEATSLP